VPAHPQQVRVEVVVHPILPMGEPTDETPIPAACSVARTRSSCASSRSSAFVSQALRNST